MKILYFSIFWGFYLSLIQLSNTDYKHCELYTQDTIKYEPGDWKELIGEDTVFYFWFSKTRLERSKPLFKNQKYFFIYKINGLIFTDAGSEPEKPAPDAILILKWQKGKNNLKIEKNKIILPEKEGKQKDPKYFTSGL